MFIDRDLAPTARGLARKINEKHDKPQEEHIRRSIAHVVQALEQPSKAKLRSAISAINRLRSLVGERSDFGWPLERLAVEIQRELPAPKVTKRRYL